MKIGQEITAKVVDFNEEAKKISLSIKALEIESQKEAEETPAEETAPEMLEADDTETVEEE